MRPLVVGLLFLYPAFAEQAIDGKAIYRSNCAFCHGLTGKGGRGPALVGRTFLHGSTASDIRAVIRDGVPGSNMPAFGHMEEGDLDRLVSFLLEMSSAGAGGTAVAGDPIRGRQIYDGSGCASCHRIANAGSVYGPDLTRIGAGRSSEYIRESLVDPSADVPDEYQGVTVVEKDGRRITGMRINEDTFSVQLRDMSQNFRMFQKDEVREVIHERRSLMPDYKSLPAGDLQNLLAYLDSLRGDVKAGAGVKKVEGIR